MQKREATGDDIEERPTSLEIKTKKKRKRRIWKQDIVTWREI